jgi:hypothetical protein
VGITAGSREQPGRKSLCQETNTNNNNNNNNNLLLLLGKIVQ